MHSRTTITVSAITDRLGRFYVSVKGRDDLPFADLPLNIDRAFSAQEDAEHYAAGVAAGLRACGRSCEVLIDVTEGENADDMLDMAALDACAQRLGHPADIDPEADPVERRLAREAEAGRFIAEARGL
jgi:hypothetical protein